MGKMYPVCPTCGQWFDRVDGETFDPSFVCGLPYEQDAQCNHCFDPQRPFSD